MCRLRRRRPTSATSRRRASTEATHGRAARSWSPGTDTRPLPGCANAASGRAAHALPGLRHELHAAEVAVARVRRPRPPPAHARSAPAGARPPTAAPERRRWEGPAGARRTRSRERCARLVCNKETRRAPARLSLRPAARPFRAASSGRSGRSSSRRDVLRRPSARLSSSSWTTVSFVTPSPAGSISHVTRLEGLGRRLGVVQRPPRRDELARRDASITSPSTYCVERSPDQPEIGGARLPRRLDHAAIEVLRGEFRLRDRVPELLGVARTKTE